MVERYIGNADSYVILISTCNRPRDLMENHFMDPEDNGFTRESGLIIGLART
jgi:hypothetical protein